MPLAKGIFLFLMALLECEWKQSSLEPVLFYLWHDRVLVGMCTTHVDDLLITGEGDFYEASVEKLKTLVDFDKDEIKHFQHCGKTADQAVDGTIELSQKERAMNIQEIGIAPSRRRQKDEACSAL